MRGGYRPGQDEEMSESTLRRLQALLEGRASGAAAAGVGAVGQEGAALQHGAASLVSASPLSQSNLPFSSAVQTPLSAAASLPLMHQHQHFGWGLPQHSLSSPRQQQAAHLPPTSGMTRLLHEQRLSIETAQLEARLHAQAQAQTQARLEMLLGAGAIPREATTQDRLMLLRQRQQIDGLLLASSLRRDAGSYGRAPTGMGGHPFQSSSSPEANALAAAASALPSMHSSGANLGGLLPSSTTNRQAAAFGLLNGGATWGSGSSTPWNNLSNNDLPSANVNIEGTLAGKILRVESGLEPGFSPPRQEYDSKEGKEDDAIEEQKMAYQEEDGGSSTDEGGDDVMNDDEYFRANPRPSRLEDKQADIKRPREAFPLKLYRILYEAERNGQSDIISFLPNGRGFAVHKSKEFIRDIMPKYFAAGKMNTFLKQLNLYLFLRITDGRDKGAYCHPKFVKGKRHLCKRIKRKRASTTTSKSAAAAGISTNDATGEESVTSRDSPTELTKLYKESDTVLSPQGNEDAPPQGTEKGNLKKAPPSGL